MFLPYCTLPIARLFPPEVVFLLFYPLFLLETYALLKYGRYLLVCYHSKLHKNLHHELFITANLI